jgi:uncharacterized protein (DUF4213/DUF364 family)
MKILDDLLSNLDFRAEVCDIRIGLFHTAVVTRSCGLAASLPRDALRQQSPLVPEAGLLLEQDAAELAGLVRSTMLLEAAVGMATINSLLQVDESRCVELNAAELLAEKGRGRRIAIVGHFPFVPRLRDLAAELWVIEKNPKPGDFGEERAAELIPRADVVGITGASLLNHTFEEVRGLCSPEAFVVVLGGTTPLSPLLFDHGVHAISGTRVTEPELVLRCVSQGASFRQIKGRRLLTMLG